MQQQQGRAINSLIAQDEGKDICGVTQSVTFIEKSMQAPFDHASLPDGWRWVRVGDISRLVNGDAYKPNEWSTSGVPIIRIQNLNDETKPFNYWSGSLYDRVRVKAGDILLAWSGTPGTSFGAHLWQRGEGVLNQHIFRVDLKDSDVVPTWFVYATNHRLHILIDKAHGGVGLRHVTKGEVEKLEIPLPPIKEQKRLAIALSEQMAAVEQARAAAESQLKAAKDLPAAYMRSIFDSQEAQQWSGIKLGEVLRLRKEVVHPRANPTGIATFVGLEHIESLTGRKIGSVELEKSKLTGRKPQFYKGDIVYGYLRPYLNKVWIAEFDGLCSVDQYVYSVETSKAIPEFVAWFMRSSIYLDRAPIDTTPGQLPRIRTEEVATVEINLPSLTEQQRIVSEITKQMITTQQACKSLQDQLNSINKLPAALLRQAFTGKL